MAMTETARLETLEDNTPLEWWKHGMGLSEPSVAPERVHTIIDALEEMHVVHEKMRLQSNPVFWKLEQLFPHQRLP